ncbi:MAG: CpsB/CapC family capsule biosynthesis tyrosine phosphatase [Gaiellales bacterium]
MAGYVDCHTHVVFGVDDGARSLDQAVTLLHQARDAGTRVICATPHVVPPYLGWDASQRRIERIRRRFEALVAHAPDGLELRLGFEVTARPQRLRADDDPARFRIAGTELVVIDGPQAVPWVGDATMERYVRRVRAEGLTPILAHPERRASWRGPHDPGFAERMKAAGALLQVDASGLTGADGPGTDVEARRLLAAGLVDLIASDGHGGPQSAVRLDEAERQAAEIVGPTRARRLVDGSAIGLGSAG